MMAHGHEQFAQHQRTVHNRWNRSNRNTCRCPHCRLRAVRAVVLVRRGTLEASTIPPEAVYDMLKLHGRTSLTRSRRRMIDSCSSFQRRKARWNRFRGITTPTMTALHASLGSCMARRKTKTTTSGRRKDPSLPEPIRQRTELELQGTTSTIAASFEAAALHYLSTQVDTCIGSVIPPRK